MSVPTGDSVTTRRGGSRFGRARSRAPLSVVAIVAIAVAACSGTAGAKAPSTTSDDATSAPSIEATTLAPSAGDSTPNATDAPDAPADNLPAEGDCVRTDQSIGAATTLMQFEATSCISPMARYRVLAVMSAGLQCPSAAGYTVELRSQLFCLTDQLTDEPVSVPIEQLFPGECVAVLGKPMADHLRTIDCGSRDADYRVTITYLEDAEHKCPSGTKAVTATTIFGMVATACLTAP